MFEYGCSPQPLDEMRAQDVVEMFLLWASRGEGGGKEVLLTLSWFGDPTDGRLRSQGCSSVFTTVQG